MGAAMTKTIPKTRLDLIMKLTGISGKVLSNSLHFDMSLISRWKNGKRRILNESYLEDLACFFYDYNNEQFKGLCKGLTNTTDLNNRLAVVEALKSWLGTPLLHDDLTEISPILSRSEHNYIKSFQGNEGRRQSVMEFLSTAIQLSSGGRILLISREDMSWLMEDEAFIRQWAGALSRCIEVGYEITIIHTVRRSMDELYKAFIQWVPFYMTGRVKAYYMTENQIDVPVQTLFAVEDLLLCEGFLYTDQLEDRFTLLTNDLLTIQSRQKNYQALIDKATRLNYVYNSSNIYQIINSIVTAGKNKEDSLFKAEELFFTTMDKSLLVEILADNEVDQRLKGYCLDSYDRLNINFDQNVRLFTNRHIYNLNTLIEQAEQRSFKAVLLSIITGKEIIIKRDQYVKHIQSTIRRLKSNPNYEIGLYLKQSTKLPLEELDFWVKEGYYLSMWSKRSYEFIQMSQEPTMVETIKRFYSQLWDMIPLIDKDKDHVIDHLEKLLIVALDDQLSQ